MAHDAVHGGSVVLRPLRPDDVDPITAVPTAPENAEWWPGYDEARVRREYFDEPDGEAVLYAIEDDGTVLGFIQSYEEPDTGTTGW